MSLKHVEYFSPANNFKKAEILQTQAANENDPFSGFRKIFLQL